MSKSNSVVILGRINVGKSTLFNRLTEKQKAIVSKVEGTTRDRNFGEVIWRGKTFILIDSGGVNINTLKNSIYQLAETKKVKYKNSIEQEVIKQTKLALQEAGLILFLVDGKSGLMPQDKELAIVLKKINKKVILVVNKIDSKKHIENITEFYKLGLGEPLAVSAASGLGTGDLLDAIFKKIKIKKIPAPAENKEKIKVSIIGKPNAGKSSLINKLAHKERSIVSPIAQTTREPQDITIKYKNNFITLIDTAGLRKVAKIKPQSIEKIATEKAVSTINKSDIVLFVLDISKPFNRQDKFLAGLITESYASLIVVLNKWDLIANKEQKKYLEYFKRTFPFMLWAPSVFISAKTGLNVKKIYSLILDADKARKIEISENALNKLLKKIIKKHKVQADRAEKRPFLHSLKQTATNPPQFSLSVSKGAKIKESYLKFLTRQIREKFEIFAAPVRIKIDQGK